VAYCVVTNALGCQRRFRFKSLITSSMGTHQAIGRCDAWIVSWIPS